MTDLEALIQFWSVFYEMNFEKESAYFIKRIQATINALFELKKLKGE